uniref:uncharacterized protein isoform X2 n=1 Tax=Pristiophorus japonicus TaxID=55135 RepID=UPI00398E44CB
MTQGAAIKDDSLHSLSSMHLPCGVINRVSVYTITGDEVTNFTHNMSSLSNFQQFTDGEEWYSFAERLEHFFIANYLDGDTPATLLNKRRATLLNSCGPTINCLIRDLLAPAKTTTKNYGERVTLIQEQLKPKESILTARHWSYTHRQPEGQEIAKYAADLRKLAAPCDFGDHLNEALRDIFVIGIGHEGLLHKLLSVDITVTLQKAIKVSQAYMISVGESKRMMTLTQDSKLTSTVNRMVTSKGRNAAPSLATLSPPHGANQLAPCWRCGGNHRAHQCRFKDYTCKRLQRERSPSENVQKKLYSPRRRRVG